MSGRLNFINLAALPQVELSPSNPKRYRVTLDLTLEDDPTQWDWEDLLELEETEKVENATFEEFL